MNKLYISKSTYGTYYSKIRNAITGDEISLPVRLPPGKELPREWGVFSCEYFLSCYKSKNDGEIKPIIIVTKFADRFKPNYNPYGMYENSSTPEIPF